MHPQRKAILLMHLATFLFGFTAILGKAISLSSINLVWHRMWLASAIFLLFPGFIKAFKQTSVQTKKRFLLIGCLVALHWLTFYGCIKLSNSASLALACFGTIAFFAALLEPLIIKTPFKKVELFLGIIIIIGLAFIAKSNPDEHFSWQSSYIQAMAMGVVSAFFAALFSVFNKKYVADNNPMVITFLQMLGGFAFLTLLLPFYIAYFGVDFQILPQTNDIIYLILLAVLCTNIAFSLEMEALKNMSAFMSNLIINLEPIYGMILAIFFFHENEMLNIWFYSGTFLIIATVFLHPLLERKTLLFKNKKHRQH
ncbi:MAG: DMT family transporter [Bacteroidetes bacterium]|nr:DMT family transporter [Bacteroidota bacterium]MCB9226286.1 DMT family transporter [Chitinophagales bacterium]